jgi:hypothetical protein
MINMVHNTITNQNTLQVDVSGIRKSIMVQNSHNNVRNVFASIALSSQLFSKK